MIESYISIKKETLKNFIEFFGGPLLNPFMYNLGVKKWYPIQLIDSRSQVDHINPKNFNYLKNLQIMLKMTG